MHTTPLSLLDQLRTQTDPQAWERFSRLYTPLLYLYGRRLGLQDSDAADLVQDVFLVLVRKLPEFQRQRDKSFRAWLRTIVANKWRDLCRRRNAAHQPRVGGVPEAAGPDDVLEIEEEEYRQYLARRALQVMQAEFQPTTWKACWEHVVEGRPAAEVAAELGISPGTVYVAKFRVLNRLRQELDGLLD
jgi:RNA polymerase sigma-70 factor (ECF subfamily)